MISAKGIRILESAGLYRPSGEKGRLPLWSFSQRHSRTLFVTSLAARLSKTSDPALRYPILFDEMMK